MVECTSEFQRLDPDESSSSIDPLVTENQNLRRKLETLPVIEQAKGIVMAHYGVLADDAFEVLRQWSQDTNTKLHLVAQTIISHRCRTDDPAPPSRQDLASECHLRSCQLRREESGWSEPSPTAGHPSRPS